ncbi:MAG: hypothetical protein WB805_15420 [Candidatus Dormiibacterota bacterium]
MRRRSKAYASATTADTSASVALHAMISQRAPPKAVKTRDET